MGRSFEIREYTEDARSPFAEWFDRLDAVTAARVHRYVRRLEAGNFGAAKALRDGVFELRLDLGRATACITDAKAEPISFCWEAAPSGGRTPTSPRRWNAGNDTVKPRHNMALTRDYKETVVARIKRDRKFARSLYAQALSALLEGKTDVGLSILRDLVHAEITFKELARQTGLGEKTLHRMLNRNGNPTARNLGLIVRSIAEDLGIKPRVEVASA
jgi:DNA-binding phage protein